MENETIMQLTKKSEKEKEKHSHTVRESVEVKKKYNGNNYNHIVYMFCYCLIISPFRFVSLIKIIWLIRSFVRSFVRPGAIDCTTSVSGVWCLEYWAFGITKPYRNVANVCRAVLTKRFANGYKQGFGESNEPTRIHRNPILSIVSGPNFGGDRNSFEMCWLIK